MTFFDIVYFLPELFFSNFILIFLWVGLYLRISNGQQWLPCAKLWMTAFNYFSVFLIFLYLLLVLNTPITMATLLGGLVTTSLYEYGLKIITCVFTIIVFFVILDSERINSLETTIYKQVSSIEIPVLRLILVLATILIIQASHFIWLFFALELYALTSYCLVAYKGRWSLFASEVALKYFILGTAFSVVSVYSIALIYNVTGLLNFLDLELFLNFCNFVPLLDNTGDNMAKLIFIPRDNFILPVSIFLLFSALIFKIAAVPFHFWAPDTYEGAPTTSVLLLSTIPKFALFTVLIKLYFLWTILPYFLLPTVALLSVLVGAIGGIFQKRFKRLLVYSMINNTGLLLFLLVVNTIHAFSVLLFFLIIYNVSLIGIFTCLLSLRDGRTAYISKNIWAFSNLFFVHKPLALALIILLFSTAGLPPLAGFLIKYFLLFGLITHDTYFYIIVLILLVLAPLTVFFYIRIIKIMCFTKFKYTIFYKSIPSLSAYIIAFTVIFTILLFVLSDTLLIILTNLF